MSSIVLKDGNGEPITFKARQNTDGTLSLYHASTTDIYLPDQTAVGMIGTTMSKFTDGFSGPTLSTADTLTSLASKWNVVRNTGMTITQTNGTLTVASGTVSGNEFLLIGKTPSTIPANFMATLMISSRVANQEIRLGYLEVDLNGVPVDNPNLASFFANHCAVLFDGTSSATVKLETMGGSHTAVQTVSATSQTASTGTIEYSLEARPEDITYQQAVANSTAAKVANGARISTMVPSPNAIYAPFVWVRNTGTTTASTTLTLQRIVSMDVQELQAEVGGGRGNVAASQAIPVVVSNNITLANAVVSTTTNGNATPHRAISAATVNATSVKTSAGKITGGLITNTTAAPKFVKFFNKTTAPVPGTDTVLFSVSIPANGNVSLGAVFDQYGLFFSSGIAYAITGAAPDLDTTVVAAGDVIVQLLYV